MNRRMNILSYILATASVIFLWVRPVFPHEWYDGDCCSDEDCAAIPVTSVHIGREGYTVTLVPGQHPFVTKRIEVFIQYGGSKDRRSHDRDFHACVGPGSQAFYCLYSPVMSF